MGRRSCGNAVWLINVLSMELWERFKNLGYRTTVKRVGKLVAAGADRGEDEDEEEGAK